AAPGHHRPDQACDGDVDAIVAAATAEVTELKGRAVELRQTIEGLKAERSALATRAREILPELESLQARILREVPSVQTVRSETNRLVQRKIGVEKGLGLVRSREALIAQRLALGVRHGYDNNTIVTLPLLVGV